MRNKPFMNISRLYLLLVLSQDISNKFYHSQIESLIHILSKVIIRLSVNWMYKIGCVFDQQISIFYKHMYSFTLLDESQ